MELCTLGTRPDTRGETFALWVLDQTQGVELCTLGTRPDTRGGTFALWVLDQTQGMELCANILICTRQRIELKEHYIRVEL